MTETSRAYELHSSWERQLYKLFACIIKVRAFTEVAWLPLQSVFFLIFIRACCKAVSCLGYLLPSPVLSTSSLLFSLYFARNDWVTCNSCFLLNKRAEGWKRWTYSCVAVLRASVFTLVLVFRLFVLPSIYLAAPSARPIKYQGSFLAIFRFSSGSSRIFRHRIFFAAVWQWRRKSEYLCSVAPSLGWILDHYSIFFL